MIFMIGVIKGHGNIIEGFRIIDVITSKIRDISYAKLFKSISRNNIKINNLAISNNKIVGAGAIIDNYPIIYKNSNKIPSSFRILLGKTDRNTLWIVGEQGIMTEIPLERALIQSNQYINGRNIGEKLLVSTENGFKEPEVVPNENIHAKISKYNSKCKLLGVDTLRFEIDNGTIGILGRNRQHNKVILPNFVDSLREELSKDNKLEEIAIPGCYNKIGNAVFFMCESLTKVTLSDGIEEIGKSAFAYCDKLEVINIPRSVKRIDNLAFSYCTRLRHIKIPNETDIRKNTFEGCDKLKIERY